MKVLGYRPSNAFLDPELEAGWKQWLGRACLAALGLAAMLAAVVGPRQENVRLRYEVAQLRGQVAGLERRHRQLLLERESLTSPGALIAELDVLGLERVPSERVAYLDSAGHLAFAAVEPAPGASR